MLIVDDDDILRERMAQAMRERGFDVRTANDVAPAIRLATEDSPELALVDLRMPGGSGLDLVRELKAIDTTTKVVVLTGYGSIANAIDAIQLGATHYLPKPADADDIIRAFERDGSTLLSEAGMASEQDPNRTAPSLARTEWEHINRVLSDCSGNISETARRLGIHRRSLQRKLQKYPPRT